MSAIRQALDWLHCPADERSSADVERDIEQELDAHLDLLTAHFEAKGFAPDEARQQAQQRFGSRDHYRDECRRINLGDRIMLQRITTCGLILLCGAVGFVLWELHSMRQEQAKLISQFNNKMAAEAVVPAMGDVTGRVVDQSQNPLPYAKLMIVIKTWPDGRYQQRAFHTISDPSGTFTLEGQVPISERYAVHVAAMHTGYTLQSQYQLKESAGTEPLEPLVFELHQATPVQLAIEDAGGNRIRGAVVAPAGRITPTGEDHSIYFQANEPVRRVSDDNGLVPLDWCTAEDRAELYVQLPGRDWESHTVQIPKSDADTLVLTLPTAEI